MSTARNRTFCRFLCFLASCAASLLAAQETDLGPEERINQYLQREVERLDGDFYSRIKTREDWERLRPELQRQYLEMLGLWPLPERTPLEAQVAGKLTRPGMVVERLHFQSLPHLYVTGNLYLPEKISGKLPAVLYVCGHSSGGRNGNKTMFQRHGFWF